MKLIRLPDGDWIDPSLVVSIEMFRAGHDSGLDRTETDYDRVEVWMVPDQVVICIFPDPDGDSRAFAARERIAQDVNRARAREDV